MFSTFFIYLLALTPLQNHTATYKNNIVSSTYHVLPRFWTNTGFCPMADAFQRDALRTALFADSMQMNLLILAALPAGALTHIRIHWLLKLVKFVEYAPRGAPIYDFTDLDRFIMDLDDSGLSPVIEFMTDLDGILWDNTDDDASYLWQDFVYQVVKRYLNLLGAKKLLQWRFETWNEPDIRNYNRLNFTVEGYLKYATALRKGLTAAGHRSKDSLHFPLRGPAGLFKSQSKHPLCWSLLEACNAAIKQCPIEILTYHRKGQGQASEVLEGTRQLLKEIYAKYGNIAALPISNDEADPIAGWSTPHDYNEDVRYAAKLIYIVLLHWQAKLQVDEFKTFATLSHDNAFISYHPHEFSQRTLLAHFRMNNSQLVHSQFIQKPVYVALAMLAKLAKYATDIETLPVMISETGSGAEGMEMWLLKTSSSADALAATVVSKEPLYLCWLLLPNENITSLNGLNTLQFKLPPLPAAVDKRNDTNNESFAYIIEMLEQQYTDPAYIWHTRYAATPYPNAEQRQEMRRAQYPRPQASGILLNENELKNLIIADFQLPWIQLIRICSNLTPILQAPIKLTITKVTSGEVFVSWREAEKEASAQCFKTYEVWFQVNNAEWQLISASWHLPFLYFQYAPGDAIVNGFYKVRGVDLFNRSSEFSEAIEYIEI